MPSEPRQTRRQRRTARARSIRRVRQALLLAFAVAVVVAGAVIALAPAGAEGRPSRVRLAAARTDVAPQAPLAARAVEPALGLAAATPPTPPPSPSPAPPLPRPAPLPNAGSRIALTEIGRIQIPKIGLDQSVREGVEQMVIDAGPAHWPGTAAFGSWGNVVLAGHRTAHTEPFRRAAELVPGDAIVLADPSGTYRYRVTRLEVVPNTALWIVSQVPGRSLTIFTCHPIGSSAQRLVVRAELMSAPRPGR
jgi:LPXTG-site transpeptidase (sortase) family protein